MKKMNMDPGEQNTIPSDLNTETWHLYDEVTSNTPTKTLPAQTERCSNVEGQNSLSVLLARFTSSFNRGDYHDAKALMEMADELFRYSNNDILKLASLYQSGTIYELLGETKKTICNFKMALRICKAELKTGLHKRNDEAAHINFASAHPELMPLTATRWTSQYIRKNGIYRYLHLEMTNRLRLFGNRLNYKDQNLLVRDLIAPKLSCGDPNFALISLVTSNARIPIAQQSKLLPSVIRVANSLHAGPSMDYYRNSSHIDMQWWIDHSIQRGYRLTRDLVSELRRECLLLTINPEFKGFAATDIHTTETLKELCRIPPSSTI